MASRHAGRSGRVWRRVRAQVLAPVQQRQADGTVRLVPPSCWLCGKNDPPADSVDHVRPLSEGGDPIDPRNLRPAHQTCNSARGARPGPTQPTSRRW